LALTADAYDPPDGAARERVQARLAAMALLPTAHAPSAAAGELVTSAPSATPAWFTSAKVLLAGVVALTLSGGFWALSLRQPESVQRAGVAAPAPGPTTSAPIEVAPLQAPEELSAKSVARSEAPAETDGERAPKRARTARAGRAAAGAEGSLARETALLRRASERLAQRELNAALSLLEEHRKSYRQSQLAQERNGLFVLAHCLRSPSEAAREARSFIASTPTSLLAPRLVAACGL
jgi:hypothetical protein